MSIDPTDTSTLSSNVTLTIAKGTTSSTGEVTITATDDSAYTGNREVTVSGSAENTAGVDGPDDVTLTITDDEAKPVVTLALDSDSISENAGVATVTASLDKQSTAATTVTVSIDPTDTSTLSSNVTLTIAKGTTSSTGEVTITATDDSAYTGNREVTVSGSAENTAGVDGPDDVTLTITDDEAKPVVTLVLTPATISESGASNASTVTATLSATSSEDTTITVSIDPTDTSTLSSNVTLTIAANQTTSTGEVTITAVNDSAYAGDREVTVSGSAENDIGVDNPDDVTLTITDDDTKPKVTLVLTPSTISESGASNASTVTATLSATSSEDTTITVSIDPTDTSTLSSNVTLTIAKGTTSSTGEVTITATDDSAYTGNREVTVSGSAENTAGVDGPDDVTLTITDDDTKPKVTLVLTPSTISESGASNASTVTATLSATSSEDTTITVSIDPTDTSTLSSNVTLTIAKGTTSSTGEVTITATDDSAYTGNREVTVSGSAENTAGVDGPDDVTLTITDDDTKPKVTLVLTPSTISESGASNASTVTATLSATSSEDTTITVSIDPTDTSTLSSNVTLTIAKGTTSSTGEVTITATDDSAYTGNREVTVSGSAENTAGVDGPDDVTLTITDDEAKPVVTLALDSDSISENAGVATVTASLDKQSTAATTVTVSIDPTDTSTLSSNVTLTIAKGTTSSTGEVTITATDDSAYAGDREVTVKGAAENTAGVDGPDDVTLTITDDEAKPVVTLVLTPATISESGASNASTVTATLSATSSEDTTITVSIDPTDTSTLSSNVTLTIAKGTTSSTGEVTITATDDSAYTGNREVTVSGSAENTAGVDGPDDVTLTITDDEAKPVVTLALDSDSISENAGVATVTASLDKQSTAATTVTVSIDPTDTSTLRGTSTLSSNVTLTIAKGTTSSTGEVTITATDDSAYTGNREVTVSGSAENTAGVDGPDDVTLTITDDEAKPVVTLVLTPATISESGASNASTVTATLSATSSEDTTITVSIDPTDTSTLSSNVTLTIAKGTTSSSGTVTITAVNGDSVYTGNREVTVSGSAENTAGVDGPDDVTLTITDDEAKPVVTLALTPATISESGASNASTVTATLSATSSEDTTITVSIDPTDTSTLSSNVTLTIAKGTTSSTGEVTITATDDSAYTGNREVTVSGSAENTAGVDGPDDVTLTITDDEAKPVVTLALDSDSISENAGVATVTASLDKQSTAATTVTVSIDPTDTSTLSSNVTLTIAKGTTSSTGEVTITATDDSAYTGNREVTVSGSAENTAGVDGPDDVTLTITDDEVRAVTVSFEQSAYTAAEGGSATVKVTLSPAPERQVVIPLTKTNRGGASSADYSGVPSTLTFGASDTEKTFTFSATADDVDDDDESVDLAFGSLPTGVSAGTTSTSTVSITDDDVPSVTVSFEQSSYTVAEGGNATVKVTLSEAPERQVGLILNKANQGGASSADYSGVPASLTFGASDTEKTFTFAATADDVDDDDESVILSFGALPTGVSAGTNSTSTVSITDDDVPSVSVSFEQASYAVVEGETEDVKVTLSAAPEREVVILLTKTEHGGASSDDYSGVPSSLTFGATDTEKSFTFTAMTDSVDESGESVGLSFGVLPTGVSAGSIDKANVSIVEVSESNLNPNVTVSFDHGSYRAEEGSIATEVAGPGVLSEVIMVSLSRAPGKTVEIPLILTNWDGATDDDYSGVPSSLTFGPTDKRKPIFLRATDDNVDDDGETVVIALGDLPSGVTAGRDKSRVYIMDNDARDGLWVHSMKSTSGGGAHAQTTHYRKSRMVTVAVFCDIPRVLENWQDLTLVDGTVITRERVQEDCTPRPWFVFHFDTPYSARELEIYGREIPSTGEPGDYKLVERRVYGRCGTANDEEEGACWGTNFVTSMADNRFVRRPGDKYSSVLPADPGAQYQYYVKYLDEDGNLMWRTNDVRPDFEGTRHDWGTQAPRRLWSGPYQGGGDSESSEQQQAEGPPPVPVNLAAVSHSDRVELTWDAVAGATSYQVLRRLQDLATYTEIGTSTTNSYTDTTAEVAVGYAYQVKAVNDAGSSDPSEHVLAMIVPPPPAAPTGFAATVVGSSVTLSWDASDDDTIQGYIVDRVVRDADPPARPTLVRHVNGETTQVVDSRAEAGAAYTYGITAINAGGRSDAATVDVDIPADTGGLTVTRSGVAFNLSWAEVEAATSYNVLRMGPGETEHSKVATSETNSYTDYPTGSGTFSYRIQPVEDGEAGDAFAPVTAEMPPPPDPPTDLQATATGSSVTLTWTAPSQTLLTYLVSRKVRDADPPEEFTLVGAAAGDATAYTDTTVEADTAYAYQLVAVGTEFESDPVEVEVDTPPASPLAGFTLVDASDQAVLASLTGGADVELADPDGGSYGIRANLADGRTVGSVKLELSGAKTVTRTENAAPYSLYGDGGANALNGESLPAGSYTLTATAYAESGLAGDELGTLEISFTVTQANRAPQFGSATYNFSVAEDAATGAAVGTVSATDADNDGITYSIESGNGDAKFAIDGSSGAITTAGALDHEITPSYALTVQADDGNGGTATATVNVTVTDVDESTAGPLTGFTLVDASNQSVLATLTAGTSVELADPNGGSYGIRADVDPNTAIGSVSLALSGAKTVSRTENVAPYSLYGDGGADALDGEPLPAGSYTLTATAYSERAGGGDELGTLSVSFTITEAG